MQMPRPLRSIAALLTLATLSACGGGSSTAVVPPPASTPAAPSYTVGGTIANLKVGGLQFASGADKINLPAAAAAFKMPTTLSTGAQYRVSISAQPARFTQRCALTNGNGTIGATDVTDIQVACADHFGVVSTLAGTNNPIKQPIGPAAVFSNPQGLVVDSGGNVYVADQGLGRIAKITPDGTVSTFAGGTTQADQANAELPLKAPNAITLDKDGNFYVVGDNMVRKISKDGVVTALAGAPTAGYADGNGAQARFNTPLGVAIDSAGNLYVADAGNIRIRKVSPAGVVSTIAGDGSRNPVNGPALQTGFNNPFSVAVDNAGNVFVADTQNNLIRKITPDGVASIYAGNLGASGEDVDGYGQDARLTLPTAIAIDNDGNLYVAESGGKIRLITPSAWVATIAGYRPSTPPYEYTPNIDGPAQSATFSRPHGIAVDAAGTVYVADRDAGRVRKIIEQ